MKPVTGRAGSLAFVHKELVEKLNDILGLVTGIYQAYNEGWVGILLKPLLLLRVVSPCQVTVQY